MAKRSTCGIVALAVAILVLLCAAAAAISAVSNRNILAKPAVADQLDPLDKARLAETLHLKRTLGDAVWPGWAEADTPILLWGQGSQFLVGHPNPPAEWEPVADDRFLGEPYFRRPDDEHENFAVQVGDHWVASMATKREMDAFIIEQLGGLLPPVLRDIAPYRLLIQPSEVQISGVLHETFHVLQAQQAPERLEAAEAAYEHENDYWERDAAMREDWQAEIDLLAEAVTEQADEQALALARRFLDQRLQRRAEHGLPWNMVDMERQLEWEEGLSKYVELAVWRQASQTPDYQPVLEMSADPDFDSYRQFPQRWSQELAQMKRQANTDGVTRFYYTGMAQAVLLDRLNPNWKADAFAPGVFLEDLLRVAVGGTGP